MSSNHFLLILLKLLQRIGDFVYPRYCEVCGEAVRDYGCEYLCSRCLDKIEWIEPYRCLGCARSLPYEIRNQDECEWCRNLHLEFSSCRACAIYDGVIKDYMHALKYEKRLYLKGFLFRHIRRIMKNETNRVTYDMIVPVPMVRGRLLDRGFNQADLLAQSISSFLGVPVKKKALRRLHHRTTQARLNKHERVSMIQGAFSVPQKDVVAGKTILIVDDVMTTGSTLNECAKTLKQSSAKDVHVFVWARGR
ncbi:ComF family protein [PVC group bacterium]|nr:ComF family protein [PVC group bacterium]